MPLICPTHNQPLIQRPGGVSKTTGKPYNPFLACPGKNADGTFCKYHPPKNDPLVLAQSGANGGVATNDSGLALMASLGRIESKLTDVLIRLERIENREAPQDALSEVPQESIPF